MELLDLLVAGRVEEFNARRGQRRRVELFASDLSGAQLAGVDLSGATLEKSDLTGADLSDANLSRCDLSGIDGAQLLLPGVTAVGAKFREAILEDADLAAGDFSHGDFSEAVLTGTRGAAIRMIGARLREADAQRINWPDAEMSEARLHKVNFTGAHLERVDITEASLHEAILVDARLDHCIGLKAKFQQANLQRAHLPSGRLEEANFHQADLSGANLEGADLRRANLAEAKLVGANLRGADLSDAVLDGADLTGADLTDAKLKGIDPRALNLTELQVGGLAEAGTVVAADAGFVFDEVSVARIGATIAMFWENPDSEEQSSLRFLILGPGVAGVRAGVLPMSAEGVLECAVVPADSKFVLLVFQERPGGAVLVRYTLATDGALSTAQSFPLGYDPAVLPVVRNVAGEAMIWGLSRRGPTLVVQRVGAEGLEVISSAKVATARGFLGGADPVLACKGGVVLPIDAGGLREPLRVPATFPGTLAATVAHGDRRLAAWDEPVRSKTDPGGLRWAWLGPGVAPVVESVTSGVTVLSLDLVATATGAWAAWVASKGKLNALVFAARVPGGTPELVELPDDVDPAKVRFATAPADDQGLPVLVVSTEEGGIVIVDLDGKVYARY